MSSISELSTPVEEEPGEQQVLRYLPISPFGIALNFQVLGG